MKFLILLLLVISFVGAESCIDINFASLDELDELVGIGPVYAGRIVDTRPFDSINDLVKVSGIGEKTLEKIKSQGLVCINGNFEVNEEGDLEDEEIIIKDSEEDLEIIKSEMEVISISASSEGKKNYSLEPDKKVIKLNSHKDSIRNSVVIYESKNERIKKYAIYGFSLFLIFIITILIWKQ